MNVIPLSSLNGACARQLDIVWREWPDGIPVTRHAAQRAVELGLELDWAARRLLTPPGYRVFREDRRRLLHMVLRNASYRAYREAMAAALFEALADPAFSEARGGYRGD